MEPDAGSAQISDSGETAPDARWAQISDFVRGQRDQSREVQAEVCRLGAVVGQHEVLITRFQEHLKQSAETLQHLMRFSEREEWTQLLRGNADLWQAIADLRKGAGSAAPVAKEEPAEEKNALTELAAESMSHFAEFGEQYRLSLQKVMAELKSDREERVLLRSEVEVLRATSKHSLLLWTSTGATMKELSEEMVGLRGCSVALLKLEERLNASLPATAMPLQGGCAAVESEAQTPVDMESELAELAGLGRSIHAIRTRLSPSPETRARENTGANRTSVPLSMKASDRVGVQRMLSLQSLQSPRRRVPSEDAERKLASPVPVRTSFSPRRRPPPEVAFQAQQFVGPCVHSGAAPRVFAPPHPTFASGPRLHPDDLVSTVCDAVREHTRPRMHSVSERR